MYIPILRHVAIELTSITKRLGVNWAKEIVMNSKFIKFAASSNKISETDFLKTV